MKQQYLVLDYYEVDEYRMELEIDKNAELTVGIHYFSNEDRKFLFLQRYTTKDFLLNTKEIAIIHFMNERQYSILKNALLDILINNYK